MSNWFRQATKVEPSRSRSTWNTWLKDRSIPTILPDR